MSNEATLAQLELLASKPVKRSKRRENSVDEDSSAQAESLKAKKNLDGRTWYVSIQIILILLGFQNSVQYFCTRNLFR
jgi:hypothetical protein